MRGAGECECRKYKCIETWHPKPGAWGFPSKLMSVKGCLPSSTIAKQARRGSENYPSSICLDLQRVTSEGY
jgi:hypothetical protein